MALWRSVVLGLSSVLVAVAPAQSSLKGPAAYEQFIADQRFLSWNEVERLQGRPTSAGQKEFAKPPREGVEDNQYWCTTQRRSITTTPERVVVLQPNEAALWVGSLLQGSGYTSGDLRQLRINKRAPITVYMNALGPGYTIEVPKPTGATVANAVGTLVRRAQSQKIRLGGLFDGQHTESHDLRSTLLKLGLTAKYGNYSASVSLQQSKAKTENQVTLYVSENLFTISMVPPGSAGEFFTNLLTRADLETALRSGRIGRNNLPVYVSDVSYGRVVMASITSTASMQTLSKMANIAVNAVKGKQKATYSEEEKQILNNSQIRVTTFGGDNAKARSLLLSGDLSAYFARAPVLTEYRPLSFTVRDLQDDRVVLASDTTSFDQKTCVAQGGTRFIDFKGANVRFGCRANGFIEGRTSSNTIQRMAFGPQEDISMMFIESVPSAGNSYTRFARNNQPWTPLWGVQINTWEFGCEGKGAPPDIAGGFSLLQHTGQKVVFSCVRGGNLSGHTGPVGLPYTTHSFGSKDVISVRDYRYMGDGSYMRFYKNNSPWPSETFAVNAQTWKVECN